MRRIPFDGPRRSMPVRAFRRWSTLFMAVPLLACADTEATPTRLTAMRDTVDGVPRLLYAATGEPSLDWSADTLAVIGDIMGDDPRYQFDDVLPAGLSGDAAGNVWLLDASGHRVIGYDSTGTFIASHGREGGGPGEINRAFGMSVGPGDTLWVMEMMGRRLTGFPAEGGEARVVSFDVDIVPAPPLAVARDHVLAEMLQMFTPDDSPSERTREFTLARFAPDGSIQDTIFSMPMPEQNVVQIESGNRRIMMMNTPEFSPSLEWAVFSDGSIAVVSDDRYSIHLLAPDGTERLRIERDAPPRAVTEADRESVREGIRDRPRIRIGGGDDALAEEMMKRQLEAMTFAETMPRIERVAVDPADRLWVLTSADEPDGDQRIDIFDRTGALLGSVHGLDLPTTFLEGGRAAYLARDEDTDVQQITLVRLNAATS